jgi:NADH:ubiquinone oxidoreductase subunit 2 (subunit N)
MLKKAVPECICLILFLLCLVGIPPTPGFIGKFTLIGVAIRHQWPVLGITAVFSMALSGMSIARFAYELVGEFAATQAPHSFSSGDSGEITLQANSFRTIYLVVLVLPIVFIALFANDVLAWAGNSLGFILW